VSSSSESFSDVVSYFSSVGGSRVSEENDRGTSDPGLGGATLVGRAGASLAGAGLPVKRLVKADPVGAFAATWSSDTAVALDLERRSPGEMGEVGATRDGVALAGTGAERGTGFDGFLLPMPLLSLTATCNKAVQFLRKTLE